jgi:hypothetical protein
MDDIGATSHTQDDATGFRPVYAAPQFFGEKMIKTVAGCKTDTPQKKDPGCSFVLVTVLPIGNMAR